MAVTRVGIVGDGIIGTAVAATLVQQYPSLDVTLIDDGRPHKTSQAGQGYLWSVNRFDDPVGLETSMMAKRAWMDLLEYKEGTENDEGDETNGSSGGDTNTPSTTQQSIHAPDGLLQKRGSLLIAPLQDASGLRDYYERAKTNPHGSSLRFVEDASDHNQLLKKGAFCGVLFSEDYTCNPPQLIEYLKTKYSLETDRRTVTNLQDELKPRSENNDSNDSGFDCVICCAGPWINELEDVHVQPVRGLLLEAQAGEGVVTPSTKTSLVEELEESCKLIPLMEFGYGTEGIHFTLSSRDGSLLIGASREVVGFSTAGLEDVEQNILGHADDFLVKGAIGNVSGRRLGFRPACYERNPNNERKYWIQRSPSDERILLVYGFEGQGVLYAPLAAMDVVKTIQID